MLISEAFAIYEAQYMSIKYRSIRLFQTHRRVGKTLIDAIGDKEISNLTLDDIEIWHNEISKNVRPNTMRNNLGAIRSVLGYMNLIGIKCMSKDLIPVPKREDTVMVWLTAKEVDHMINCAYSLRNKFIISLIYSSGIRVSEAVSLDRGQIRDRSFLVKGKGSKVRQCFIDDRTEMLMDEYLKTRHDKSPALIISNQLKERVTYGTIELIIKNSAKRAGFEQKITPHTLRHSFASNFTINNGNQRYLQMLLGHASLATTQIYSHVHNNELREKYNRYHTV